MPKGSVRPFPSGEGRWQVSVGGGRFHCWMRDGAALVYMRDGDRKVFRARFESEAMAKVANPEPLFELPAGLLAPLDVSPDGTRFLSIRQLPAKFSADQVCVVLNWFEELKAKFPAGSR